MKIAIKTETTKRNQLEILGGEKYNNWTENFMRAIQQQTWVERRKNQWNWRQFIGNHWVRGRNIKKKKRIKTSEKKWRKPMGSYQKDCYKHDGNPRRRERQGLLEPTLPPKCLGCVM